LASPGVGGAAVGVRAGDRGGNHAAGAALDALATAGPDLVAKSATRHRSDLEASGNPSVRHPVDVIRTIDGDTFEARVHLWPGLNIMMRVRLRGIDAPELKARCEKELRMAEAASDALQNLLADGDVTIYNIGPDKYQGRVDADVATRRTPNVSDALLAAGFARAYDGGHRSGWCGGR
jgi:endonuclease YncB( thermonuclease family)